MISSVELTDGFVWLPSPQGLVDTRTGKKYAEAVVKAADAKYFAQCDPA